MICRIKKRPDMFFKGPNIFIDKSQNLLYNSYNLNEKLQGKEKFNGEMV